MAGQPLRNRNRAMGLAGALLVHAAMIAGLLLLAPRHPQSPASEPSLVAVPLAGPSPAPPPPPPPDDIAQGAAERPSRGTSEAPSPPEPALPLAPPAPAEPAPDVGPAAASGRGAAAGSGAGQGGAGSGSGLGTGGSGLGAGRITPPERIEGALTHADYRRARPPAGAAGTVSVTFRVRTDGRVGGCSVLRSSGYAVFDRATCRLIEERFRFRPAHDESGDPVEWDIRTEYTWTPR